MFMQIHWFLFKIILITQRQGYKWLGIESRRIVNYSSGVEYAMMEPHLIFEIEITIPETNLMAIILLYP